MTTGNIPDAEPLVPLTRSTERRLIDDLLPGRQTDGLSVRAQWSQADGVSVALRVQVRNVTGSVVAVKTIDDLRVVAELGIDF